MDPNRDLPIDDVFLGLPSAPQGSDVLELPLSRSAFWVIMIGAAVLLVLIIGRISYLGILREKLYTTRALRNAHTSIIIAAPRGLILDRFGKEMVSNRSSFSIRVNLSEFRKDRSLVEPALQSLATALEIPADDLRAFLGAVTEDETMIKIADDITLRQAISLRDLSLPGVSVVADFARAYADPEAFSHIVGYGTLAGLEGEYNETLKGIDGERIEYRDAKGTILGEQSVTEPKSGENLATTIDSEFQIYVYSRMQQALRELGREAGVGVALNPQNGEILALTSFPGFNTGNIVPFLKEKGKPLFNRVVSGVYTPGSTIKPLVALAALHEGIVAPDFGIYSNGFIEVPNPFDPAKPSKFLDWRAHGWVDLKSALARSSNIYFYGVGGGLPRTYTYGPFPHSLGIAKLNEYWRFFGFGEETGIDIPSEKKGFLPDQKNKEERTGVAWRLGDTYNVSIGQGDIQVTPLQLLSFIASIGNGGKIFSPSVAFDRTPSMRVDYSSWKGELAAVREGMRDAIKKSYGTAHLLDALPFPTAGKTGSSQVANNTRTNAFFVGYGPASDTFRADDAIPQIAILILIENSKEGSLNTVPVARDIFAWYYEHRLKESFSP